MDKIDAIQGMRLVLDAAIHMDTTSFACVALNSGFLIDDCELVAVRVDAQVVARHHSDLRKKRALGFPALGASTDMVMRTLSFDADRYLLVAAMANERPTRKICGRRFQSVIDLLMYLDVAHVIPSWLFAATGVRRQRDESK